MPKASQNKQFVDGSKNTKISDTKMSASQILYTKSPSLKQPKVSPSPSQFYSPTPTKTPSQTPTQTTTNTPTRTPSNTPTNTVTPSKTPIVTPSNTVTTTNTPTNTVTPTNTPTNSVTPTYTSTNTSTLTPTATSGVTLTPTSTNTPTPSLTPSFTPTNTITFTPSATTTPTVTKTPTQTRTQTNTVTKSVTPTSSIVNSSTPTPTTTATPTLTPISINQKKGIGLNENAPLSFGNTQLSDLGVSWYYSWGLFTDVVNPVAEFIPMEFSLSALPNLTPQNILLGFNEPDSASQANLTVETALANWPTLVSNSTFLGSPATAGNPLTAGSWLQQFMSGNPKVDFVCVHWYKGPDSARFISDMTDIINLFSKPIWVTEFAPQTVSSSNLQPNKYTQAQVNSFINTVIPWMNSNPMVERYAWHNSKTGTSATFTSSGQLTETGIAYRNAQ